MKEALVSRFQTLGTATENISSASTESPERAHPSFVGCILKDLNSRKMYKLCKLFRMKTSRICLFFGVIPLSGSENTAKTVACVWQSETY